MTNHTTYIVDPRRTFALSDGAHKFESLADLLCVEREDHRQCTRLQQAISQLDFDFYGELLPKIARWASDHTQAKAVEPLRAGKTASVTYTAAQVRYILANAFFLNVTPGYGNINLSHLYNSWDTYLSLARIRCLIEYFRLSEERDQQREISIERYSYEKELPDWAGQNVPIRSSRVRIFTDRMEDAQEARGFVDFANKHIHIHRIIPSATQEEVLFSCCPEAFPSILLCETLRDDEIVILRGCKRFVDYTGYGDTFAYKGHYPDQSREQIQDILVIDAVYSGQFQRTNIDRDLGKAWAGFVKSKDTIIATGNWGCGVFGGDLIFKFLQQTCAAMILDNSFQRLEYSAYHDESLASNLTDLIKALEVKKKTVADVYRMMCDYEKVGGFPASRSTFQSYVDKWLSASS